MKNYFNFQLNGRKFFSVYLPEYFSERTGSNIIDNQTIKFGYDLEQWKDFTLIWGQTLLTLITLGLYYPRLSPKLGREFWGRRIWRRFRDRPRLIKY